MENKQTAVDWLFTKQDLEDFDTLMLYKIAKQMEKEQIIEAHGIKNRGGFKSNGNFFVDEFTGEQYYNETYGK